MCGWALVGAELRIEGYLSTLAIVRSSSVYRKRYQRCYCEVGSRPHCGTIHRINDSAAANRFQHQLEPNYSKSANKSISPIVQTMANQQLHSQTNAGKAEEGDATAAALALPLEERLALCLSVGECVTEENLRSLLQRKANPICYDGFEPSGRMHLAQGILKAINVNKLTKSGCTFIFWVADWFGLLNNKMGGNLENIQLVGNYFIEVWKAAGMDMTHVKFLWASEHINQNSNDYWLRVMDIARSFSISRIKRCSQIMGRSEGDDQVAAQILYPCMQCADIFELKVDICQLGMDQRKVNMLAREYCEKNKILEPPVILSHAMLPGLNAGDEKMSKSDPNSAIFMDDSPAEVNQKIKKAFCPPNVVEGNRCVSYVENLVLPKLGSFTVKRTEKNGGDVVYATADDLKAAVLDGTLHPADLKSNLAAAINEILDPVRKHFETDAYANNLLKQVKALKTSR